MFEKFKASEAKRSDNIGSAGRTPGEQHARARATETRVICSKKISDDTFSKLI